MTITVYSRPGCYPCLLTKKKMDQLGIVYQSEDLTPYDAERFRDEGHREAPVVVTPQGTWSGYRPDLISGLLDP